MTPETSDSIAAVRMIDEKIPDISSRTLVSSSEVTDLLLDLRLLLRTDNTLPPSRRGKETASPM